MNRGFTLIESLLATLILATGLAAVASAFSYSSISSLRVQQQTTALSLLASKMEVLRTESGLQPGRYSEDFSVSPEGSVQIRDPERAAYRMTWEITGEAPRRVTAIIWGAQAGRKRAYLELARATAVIGGGSRSWPRD